MEKKFNNSVQGAGYINAVIPQSKNEKNRFFYLEVSNTITGAVYNVKLYAKDDKQAAELAKIGQECFENRKNAKQEGYEHKTHTVSFSGVYQPAVYDNEKKELAGRDVISVFDFQLEPVLKDLKVMDKCEFAGNIVSMEPRKIGEKDAISLVLGNHFKTDGREETSMIQSLVFKGEKPGAFEQLREKGVGDFIRIEGRISSNDQKKMFINTNNVILIRKKGQAAKETAEVEKAPAKKAQAAEKKPAAKRTSRKKTQTL